MEAAYGGVWSGVVREGDIILKSYDVEWSKPLVCPPAMMPYKKLPLLSHTRDSLAAAWYFLFSLSLLFSLKVYCPETR
jgi:hypothetical protein